MNKNKEKLLSFLQFCRQHPQERFWQALRNWSEATAIYYEKYEKGVDDNVCEDTFYWK